MKTTNDTRFSLGVSMRTIDFEQRLDTIVILGGSQVKAVELWEPTFEKDDDKIENARRALTKAGIEPRTIHANFGNTLDISSPDPAIRAAGLQAVGAAIRLAVGIGARMVIVHPSAEPISDNERDARIKQAKHSIETIVEMARQSGCRVAIELLPRDCLGHSVAELLRLLEGIDAETAGVCLDTNHLMNGFSSLPEVVRSLGPRLFALHCSDYDGIDEKHWPPLRGVIDWPAFLSALGAAGFSGPLLYEATLDGQTPTERLAFLESNFSQLMKVAPRRGTTEHRTAGNVE